MAALIRSTQASPTVELDVGKMTLKGHLASWQHSGGGFYEAIDVNSWGGGGIAVM